MKYFSLIYQGDIHVKEDEKVVPQESYSQLVEAHEIVEKAKEDRERLLEETRAECDKLRQEAIKAGHKEGLEQLNEKIVSIDEKFVEWLTEANMNVPKIAIAAARKIVGNKLQDPETIYDIIRNALKPVSDHKVFTIYLSSEDRKMLEEDPEMREKISDNLLSQVKTLRIDTNPELGLKRGDVAIESDQAFIHAELETQFDMLQRALIQGRQ